MIHDSEKNPTPPIPDPRVAQAQPLRDLAHTWYALAVACKRIGAMIERAAKEILHGSISDDNTN